MTYLTGHLTVTYALYTDWSHMTSMWQVLAVSHVFPIHNVTTLCLNKMHQ